MKNIETPDKKHLEAIINDLRDGKYGIPNFQRDFEWNPWEVNDLIKSIFEDYYIGTLLLWRASKENIDYLSCKPIWGAQETRYEHIILDGQQRLSALYYAFFAPSINFPNRKSRYYYCINIDKLLNEDYEEAFEYQISSKKIDKLMTDDQELFKQKLFPLSLFGQTSHKWARWLDRYEDFWSQEGDPEKARQEKEKLEDIFESIRNEYYISFIELDREIEVEKVCDIFQRINSTGLDLNIFDLLNAILTPKNIHLKSMWQDSVNDLNDRLPDPDKGKVYILQTMSILKQGYCAPKYLYYLVPGKAKPVKSSTDFKTKDTILISNRQEFIDLWNLSIDIFQKGLDRIQNSRDYGAISPKFIPYPTMVPIFSALNFEKDKQIYSTQTNLEEKIRQWYWASIFAKNYSSGVESQIQKDWSDICKWFLSDEAVPSIVEQSELIINNMFLTNESQQGSAVYRAIFNILVLKGAKDWNTFDLPEYSNLEDHHIVPKSWGKRNNIYKINSILNRTPLADTTNKKIIGDKLPNEYLEELLSKLKDKDKLYDLMNTHLISRKAVDILMRQNFSEKDFEEFIEEREVSIKKEIKKLLRVDDLNFTGLIQPNKPYSNRMLIKNLIKNSYKFIDWVDKYFSSAGLEMLAEAINSISKADFNKIRIITSIDKVSYKLREEFKNLRDELKNLKIDIDMKVITDNKIKSSFHDRWFITEGKSYNIPSTDTMAVGQYSEIKETSNLPPFDIWWDSSLDIVYDWNEIQKIVDGKNSSLKLTCKGKGALALGIYHKDGRMTVLKNSTTVANNAPAFTNHNYKKIKDYLIRKKVLLANGNLLVFTSDYIFDSPSAAAAVILGRSASGPEEWKNANNQTLKEIE